MAPQMACDSHLEIDLEPHKKKASHGPIPNIIAAI